MKTGSGWIFIYLLCYAVKEAPAVYCGYQTSTGITQHTICFDMCCEGPNITFENVCCRYNHEAHLYSGGAAVGILIVFSSAGCLIHICCKRKCLFRPRSSESPSRANDGLPTISARIQPLQSLPYAGPPPYCLEAPGTSFKEEEQFSIPEDPPPPYSLYDTAS